MRKESKINLPAITALEGTTPMTTGTIVKTNRKNYVVQYDGCDWRCNILKATIDALNC
jgi:hypothetical protein